MTNLDLPPAYSVHVSTASIEAAEAIPIAACEDDAKRLLKSFEDKTTRQAFIQKVLVIKFLQLMGVIIIMTFCLIDYHNFGNIWRLMYDNPYILLILSLVYVIMFGLLIYCAIVHSTNPCRYILLVTYPLSYTLIICSALSLVERLELFAAWYYYCLAVLAVLVYGVFAFQTKLEFNFRYAMFVGLLVLILMFAVTYQFFCRPGRSVFYIVYSIIAVGLDFIFFLFNLEKIVSKKYRVIITPDDFVNGAINLHTDYYFTFVHRPIVNCFKVIRTNSLHT